MKALTFPIFPMPSFRGTVSRRPSMGFFLGKRLYRCRTPLPPGKGPWIVIYQALLHQEAANSVARLAYIISTSLKQPFPKVLASRNTRSAPGFQPRTRLDYREDITLGKGQTWTSYMQLRKGLRPPGWTRLGLLSPRHQKTEPSSALPPRRRRPPSRPPNPSPLSANLPPLPSVGS